MQVSFQSSQRVSQSARVSDTRHGAQAKAVCKIAPSARASARASLGGATAFPNTFLQAGVSRAMSKNTTRTAATRRALTVHAADPQRVLIVNTNAGGHAVMGFYLVKALRNMGHEVTICTVGDETDPKMLKPPFNRFSELQEMGAKTVWAPRWDALPLGQPYDVVVDNNGKKLEVCKPVIDWAKAVGAKQFLFVSSAGMYVPGTQLPIVEGDPIKESAGHAEVEKYLANESGLSWASFRPQYMIGSGNNKDCEEYFFDRLVRGRPVCIPGSGDQITNIAHAMDNAEMMALAVGNPAAHAQVFNCVRDRGVTLDGLVELCAAAAGVEPKIVHYDPAAVGVAAKKAFPFRTEYHFFAEPRAAMELLGWKSSVPLGTALEERFREYHLSGRGNRDMSFEMDDQILAAVNVSV